MLHIKAGDRVKQLIELYITFFRVGAFTFGGGYAMLPILEKEVVEDKGWITKADLLDYFAIGQTTPGAIAINTATLIGIKRKGNLGGAIATLGVVTPSLFIIVMIAMILNNFADSAVVNSMFNGIRVSVYILILNVVINLAGYAITDALGIAVFIIIFLLASFTSISPILLVVFSGMVGVGVKRLETMIRSERKKGE